MSCGAVRLLPLGRPRGGLQARAAGVLSTLLLVLGAAAGAGTASAQARNSAPAKSAPASAADQALAARLKGQEIRAQLTPRRYTTLAAEVGARVQRLAVSEGGAFTEGQVLVMFDCTVQQAQLDKARAELDAAQATLKSNERLLELNSVGQLELELSRSAVGRARAEVGMHEAVLSKCTVRAPWSGRVAEGRTMVIRNLNGELHGVVWDGSGDGGDHTLWGGELLQVSRLSSARLGHLRPFCLPGGEGSIREPRRVALALLREAYGSSWRRRLQGLPGKGWNHGWQSDQLDLLEQGLEQGINTVRCSSVGRLFDGVAALLNLDQICSFEAQAAMQLEALAESAPHQQRSYALPLAGASPFQWDWRVMLEEVLVDLEHGCNKAHMARSFHQGLAKAVADAADRLGCTPMLLAGGCFQNRLLLELCVAEG